MGSSLRTIPFVVWRAAPLAVGAGALSLALKVSFQYLLLFALALWFVELIPFLGGFRASDYLRPEEAHSHVTRSLIELAVLAALALGMTFLGGIDAKGSNARTIRFDDDTRAAILALANSRGATAATAPGQVTLKLDPKVQDAIVDALKESHAPGFGGWWGIAILLAITVATAILLYKLGSLDRESATPLATGSGIAFAMIYEARVLPKPGGWIYWLAVFALIIVGAYALCRGYKLLEIRRHSAPASPAAPEVADASAGAAAKESKEQSPLVIGFSLLLIAASLAYVGTRPKAWPLSKKDGVIVSQPVHSYQVTKLDDVTKFAPGSSTGGKTERLKAALQAKTAAGDTLLLVGSTDCTPAKITNKVLAEQRARWTKTQLAGQASTPTIEVAKDVPQQEACKASEALRSVHAFLFHETAVTKSPSADH
jgi:hypothetical protein